MTDEPSATETADPGPQQPENGIEEIYPGVPLTPGATLEPGQWGIVDTTATLSTDLDMSEPVQIQMTTLSIDTPTGEQEDVLREAAGVSAGENMAMVRFATQLLADIPEGYVVTGGNTLFEVADADRTSAGFQVYSAVSGIDFCRSGQSFSSDSRTAGNVIYGCLFATWEDGANPPAGLLYIAVATYTSTTITASPFAESPAFLPIAAG